MNKYKRVHPNKKVNIKIEIKKLIKAKKKSKASGSTATLNFVRILELIRRVVLCSSLLFSKSSSFFLLFNLKLHFFSNKTSNKLSLLQVTNEHNGEE